MLLGETNKNRFARINEIELDRMHKNKLDWANKGRISTTIIKTSRKISKKIIIEINNNTNIKDNNKNQLKNDFKSFLLIILLIAHYFNISNLVILNNQYFNTFISIFYNFLNISPAFANKINNFKKN